MHFSWIFPLLVLLLVTAWKEEQKSPSFPFVRVYLCLPAPWMHCLLLLQTAYAIRPLAIVRSVLQAHSPLSSRVFVFRRATDCFPHTPPSLFLQFFFPISAAQKTSFIKLCPNKTPSLPSSSWLECKAAAVVGSLLLVNYLKYPGARWYALKQSLCSS